MVGKVFAIVYMLYGLSILATFVSMLAKQRQVIHTQRVGNSDNESEQIAGKSLVLIDKHIAKIRLYHSSCDNSEIRPQT